MFPDEIGNLNFVIRDKTGWVYIQEGDGYRSATTHTGRKLVACRSPP